MGKTPLFKKLQKKLRVSVFETTTHFHPSVTVALKEIETREDLENLVVSAAKKLVKHAREAETVEPGRFDGYVLHFGIRAEKSLVVFLAAIFNREETEVSFVTGDLNLAVDEAWKLIAAGRVHGGSSD